MNGEGLDDLVSIYQAQVDAGMVRVPEQEVYPVGIQISGDYLAERRPTAQGNIRNLTEEAVGASPKTASASPEGLFSKGMGSHDLAGELLMSAGPPAGHKGLDLRIAAKNALYGMGEGGMAQIVQKAS